MLSFMGLQRVGHDRATELNTREGRKYPRKIRKKNKDREHES